MLDQLLGYTLLGNTVARWAAAAAITLTVLALLTALRRFVRNRYERMRQTQRHEWLELPFRIAERTTVAFLLMLAIGAGLGTLSLTADQRGVVGTVVSVVVCFQLGIWASVAVITWLERRRDRTLAHDRAAAGTFTVIAFVTRIAIWTLVLLLMLDNLGIDITALVTGLGIGGVAVALAVQNILGDLLASLSITLDKPFVLGDFLSVDDFLGSVEYIGIKSTRLRSLSGEQIVMSNADLLTSRVRNYGRMAERRVVFTFTVTHDTPHERLVALPGEVRAIVGEHGDRVRFDRSHLSAFTPIGIDFETVYYVRSPDYNVYMDIQQTIYLALHALLTGHGMRIATPVQRTELAGDLAALARAAPDAPDAPATG
jgi:small-conductance mechanosensitive channel